MRCVPEVTRRGSPLSVTRDVAARPVHDRTRALTRTLTRTHARRADVPALARTRVSVRGTVVLVGVMCRTLG